MRLLIDHPITSEELKERTFEMEETENAKEEVIEKEKENSEKDQEEEIEKR